MPPAATGSFADKPLAHLLVYALEKRLTGSFELVGTRPTEAATIVLVRGAVARIRTKAAVAYLGALLYELGFIQVAEMNESLLELSKQKKPHGQILLARGSLTHEKLEDGLREQTLRKLAHAFAFKDASTFAFHDGVDLLPGYGGEDLVLTDPSPAIWRGIREHPSEERAADAVRRIGSAHCRLVRGARIERFQFPVDVLEVTECLRMNAVSVETLQSSGLLPPKTLALLLYCLLITKEIEVIDAAALPKHASLPELDAMRSSVAKMRAVTPTSSPIAEIPPGQASPKPVMGGRRTEPISFTLPAAAPVPPRVSLTPPRVPSTPSPALAADIALRVQAYHERAKTIRSEDFFRRLSLPRDASAESVEQAFVALARMWNPAELPPVLEAGKESCAHVRAMLTEARDTLIDTRKRNEYLQKLQAGPVLPDAASDLAESGEKDEYAGAKACLLRGDIDRAERMVKRAHKAKPTDAARLALFAWIAAQRPENHGVEATKARIMMLDKAARMDPNCEDAFWYRGQLHKRVANHAAAMKDFETVTNINPSNVEAMRELKIYEMRVRHNSVSMKAVRPSQPAGSVPPTSPSGLFDRFRKKT